jgi:predicted anti-sigma-YlaC factor YlaD
MLTPAHRSDCLRARGALSARLDGPLAALDALRLDVHLGTCADCRGYAADLGAIAALLRDAPLEQPGRAMFAPAARPHRRPEIRLWMAAAAVAAVLLAAAASSSFMLGRVIGGRGQGNAPATVPAEILTLRADSKQQHVLAMAGARDSGSSRGAGRVIAL